MRVEDKVLIKLKTKGIDGVTVMDFLTGTRLSSYIHRLRGKGHDIKSSKCVDSPLYKYWLVEQP